jgi:hypothetical protein
MNITLHTFQIVLYDMAAVAVAVFIALYHVKAGYGICLTRAGGSHCPTNGPG